MFERFSGEARDVVTGAREESLALRHGRIGTEHLLLGMLREPGSLPARLLAAHDLDATRVRAGVIAAVVAGDDLDAQALSSIGIDLDTVRERVEETFGPGALDLPAVSRGRVVSGRVPLTPRAKKSLELALREAVAMHSRQISSGHLLLGVLREGAGLAARVLREAGLDLPALAEEVRAGLRAEAGSPP